MSFPSASYDAWKTTEPELVADCEYYNDRATTRRGNEEVCADCAADIDRPDEDEDDLDFRRDAEIDRHIDERRGK